MTAAAAVGRLIPLHGVGRLPIAFSTLGCPKWPWATIVKNAADNGFAAIELRGLEGEMDLPKRPELTDARIASTLADLKAADLRVASLGSSVTLHVPEADKHAEQMAAGRRFIDLAHRLGAPYVRIFGDKTVAGEAKSATIARIAEGMHELGAHAKGSGVTVLIESHGDYTDSATLLQILEKSGEGTGLLWDTHHTVVTSHERPSDTFARVGKYVHHTHIKDSVPGTGDERHYVLTGKGDVPIGDIVKTLVSGGYKGFFCFEWEKAWHPDIAEPEIAIPQYAQAMRGYLEAAGYRS
jgi:sugar phosphate isomerase/epimerase